MRSVNDRAGRTIHALAEDARLQEPQLGLYPISVDTARMLAAGIVEMALIAQEEHRPLDTVRATATALLRRVLLAPEPEPVSWVTHESSSTRTPSAAANVSAAPRMSGHGMPTWRSDCTPRIPVSVQPRISLLRVEASIRSTSVRSQRSNRTSLQDP